MAAGGSRELATSLGPVGVWSFALQRHRAIVERSAVRRIESLGYPAIWIPESVGSKEAFAHAGLLLAAGESARIATGVANIWARDPVAMANGARTLADAFPDRFVLGMGVSHAPSVARRGGQYERPYLRARRYLDGIDAARFDGPEPERPAPRMLAALGPRMLDLAAERTAGAHSYFVPVEHTASARDRLGPAPVLAVELTTVLEADPVRARSICRSFASGYLELPNYANNLRRLGFGEGDLSEGGSDRLIDAVFAWGDVPSIAARVSEHLAAGADHVCVQVIAADERDLCLEELGRLAPALLPR